MSVADPHQSASLKQAFAAVFPLPLTALEAFMVADGRPGNPMMCDLELQLEGSIDRAAFDAALAFAIPRNPLFTCRIERTKNGALSWVATDHMPAVDWAPLGTPLDDRYETLLDLSTEIGLRIWVRQGVTRSTVLLHFHHACADAIGAFGFIEDLLAGYTAAYPGTEPVAPRPLEPHMLRRRGEVGLAGRSLWRRMVDTVVGAREGARFFLQSPLPLAPAANNADAATRPPNRPAFITVTCPQETVTNLRRVSLAAGATVNDVLMRDLFVVMRRWNSDQGQPPGRRRLRVLMPQNLREPEDGSMPAANVMSFAFVTRRASWCDTPDELLESLREETEAVRRGKLSLYFTGGLASLQSAGLLPSVLGAPFCFATTVLTNLSDPVRRFIAKFPRSSQGLVVGNLVFQGIIGVPPLRPRTHAAFAIFNRAQSLSISFKWDPASYSLLEAQNLLNEYVAQLEVTAAGAGKVIGATAAEPISS